MLEKQLEKYFKFSQFRPGQKEIIESILAGQDVVALMPTGGGKSLCYQLPGILQEKLTIVISPLIALMKDQVDSLTARGIEATFINSSITATEMNKRMQEVSSGKIKLLYIAPERLSAVSSKDFFANLEVGLLAVDEAHCVSQWGHDFRPDYLLIRDYINKFKNRPTIAALTATATTEVREDIVQRLALKDPKVFIRGFDRPNLKFFVQKDIKPKLRYLEILRLIKSIQGSGIVYALTRKETEAIVQHLAQNGIKAAAYHAGMSANQREKVQNEFMENRFKVIVATIAFGMGVDKADIRFVIHSGMPKNLEGYYQEAGRAGRDGEKAYCILLHSKKDITTHNHFIYKDRQEMLRQGKSWDEINRLSDIKKNHLEKISQYITSDVCRRKIILQYFDDPDFHKAAANCKGCDVCLNWKKETQKTDSASVAQKNETKEITDTVKETIRLYQQNYSPEQIAKIRSLGINTIYFHLIRWYLAGGEISFDKLITPSEEKKIIIAMSKAADYQRLKSIKEQLPEEIGYEKIRLVLAKIQKIYLG